MTTAPRSGKGLSRRNLFSLGGAAALTIAGGSSAALAGGLQGAGDVDWPGLRKALDGSLYLPGDPAYAQAALPYNSALGPRTPAAIAMVNGRTDIKRCLTRAAGHGIPIAPRSGGHSYAGYSTPDGGLVIDVSRANKITIKDDGTVQIGAGARLSEVYAALAARGRALPGGSCPSVGIAGLTLGGGIGVLSRPYGLTCDHLTSAHVVTAGGELLRADAKRNADLFWALRGGGGGQGGVVTDLTFATVAAPTVTVFSLTFPNPATPAALSAWSQWIETAPKAISSVCHINSGTATDPSARNRIVGTFVGTPSKLPPHLSTLIAAVGTDPTARTVRSYTYLGAMQHFAGQNTGREKFRAASRVLKGTLSTAQAQQVTDLMAARRGLVLLLDSLGGEVADLSPTDTAFVHRKALASVQIYTSSATGDPAVLAVQKALTPLTGPGSYVNYLNAGQNDWGSAYWGKNLTRLRKVVKKYDPDGVLDFAQNARNA
ncbi:FAD-binding oxidoreductase [Kineosporia rhizophila]|uniref:FAD-binding oxidoreductase n=1 Tax=Kineosporia rhizophila TaxID=84633 RepID=UPI001E65082E|nr:FAD-binding oxidoreductase [Kineosporia rhizophila]MCE0539511.1 FAD-binding oxidoreductase [Kineosporia rhizophila]